MHFPHCRSIEPGRFPVIEADQIIVPGPLFKMTPPPVWRLAVIPKRVVGIEVTTNHKIGLGDPQCAHTEVSLISLSDGRAVDVGNCNTAAPCCL